MADAFRFPLFEPQIVVSRHVYPRKATQADLNGIESRPPVVITKRRTMFLTRKGDGPGPRVFRVIYVKRFEQEGFSISSLKETPRTIFTSPVDAITGKPWVKEESLTTEGFLKWLAFRVPNPHELLHEMMTKEPEKKEKKPKPPKAPKEPKPKKHKKEKSVSTATREVHRIDVLGYAVTAVLRWMGKQGWTFQQARTVLNRFKAKDTADNTIRAQLRAGAKGERGPAAPLTKEERQKLTKAKKGAK